MELTQQPAQQEAEHAESFREAMFGAVRAQVQALPDAPDPVPFMCGLEATNAATFELTEADVDAEVERIERERQEADSAFDKFKNSRAYDDARDARAYWSRNGRSYEDRPL